MSEVENRAIAAFRRHFGEDPKLSCFAPGRVNLIGEHTDYNDGFVLPFALPFRTYIVGSLTVNPGEKTSIVTCSFDDDNTAFFDINSSLSKGTPTWANYVKGTIAQYLNDLPPGFAFKAAIASDVPIGSGLSSSASLEVATATFLEQLCNLKTPSVTKALRCQKAEHTFADTPCGIMDQYISTMGCQKNLLLIDCRTQEYKLVPFASSDNAPVVLVTNSNVKHTLSGSEYPDRVRQCKEAVAAIQKKHNGVKALRDCTMEMLDSVKTQMPAVNYNRARHCIKEDKRTLDTVQALKDGKYDAVGKYMTESHRSLQHDYEVSCSELDKLVELALEVEGVYGSRMTGGGFGGCTVTLVEKKAVGKLKEHLKKHFEMCECYESVPSDGAGISDMADAKKKHRREWWVVAAAVFTIAAVAAIVVSRKR